MHSICSRRTSTVSCQLKDRKLRSMSHRRDLAAGGCCCGTRMSQASKNCRILDNGHSANRSPRLSTVSRMWFNLNWCICLWHITLESMSHAPCMRRLRNPPARGRHRQYESSASVTIGSQGPAGLAGRGPDGDGRRTANFDGRTVVHRMSEAERRCAAIPCANTSSPYPSRDDPLVASSRTPMDRGGPAFTDGGSKFGSRR